MLGYITWYPIQCYKCRFRFSRLISTDSVALGQHLKPHRIASDMFMSTIRWNASARNDTLPKQRLGSSRLACGPRNVPFARGFRAVWRRSSKRRQQSEELAKEGSNVFARMEAAARTMKFVVGVLDRQRRDMHCKRKLKQKKLDQKHVREWMHYANRC